MDSTVELVKALLQFFFLFGLVLILAWLTTRFVGGRMGGYTVGSSMRVLQHIPAGRDRSILLLEVGGRVYLLGVTTQQITLLDAIDDEVAIGRILANAPGAGISPVAQRLPRSFAEVLSRVLGRSQPNDQGDDAQSAQSVESGETARLREQIERLRRMQNK